MKTGKRVIALAIATWIQAGSASALTLGFTEEFETDVAGWKDADSQDLGYVASGGPDGGAYASGQFNYFGFSNPFGGGPVTHRAQDEFSASDGMFIGDWLAEGVGEVTVWFRHDAEVALSLFLRVSGSANFPGAVVINPMTVLPNTWTQVSFLIDPMSPLCMGEGITCAEALGNVGHLQFGTDAPEAQVALDAAVTLDIDKVSILPVPEPGTVLLLGGGIVALAALRRNRNSSRWRSERLRGEPEILWAIGSYRGFCRFGPPRPK